MTPRMGHLTIILMILILLLLVACIGPFLIPVPAVGSVTDPAELADADSHFLEINGQKVHYKIDGSGEPVMVLLHGFASNVDSWRKVMQPLSEIGTVTAYDRTGFGLSERPEYGSWKGENPYSTDAQANLLIGLMDALNIKKAYLVGNSAGGTLAVYTALLYPQRVQALVLVDAAIYIGGGIPDWIKPLLRTPQMRRLGPLPSQNLASRGDQLIETAWHDPSKISDQTLEDYRRPLKIKGWDKALWEFTLASTSLDLPQKLSLINAPTLVLTGDDDRIVPTEQSVRLAQELPDARLMVIQDCGHVPQEECPEEFLRAVTYFILEHLK